MKIGQKILSGVICVIVLTAIPGYVCVQFNKRALVNKIETCSIVQTAAILNAIDLKIHSRIEQVEAYAENLTQDPEIKQYIKSFQFIDDIPEFIQKNDRQWKLDVQKGRVNELMRSIQDRPLSHRLSEEFELKDFYEAKKGYPIWAETVVTNQYGVNIAQSRVTSDFYQADEAWWNIAKEQGAYIGDVEYDDSAEVYSIAVCKRINDEAGNFLGVIKTILNIREAFDFLDNAKSNSPFKTLTLLTQQANPIHFNTQNQLESSKIIPKPITDFIGNTSKTEWFYIGDDAFGGKRSRLFVCIRSKGYEGYPGLGWTLLAEYNADEIFVSAIELKTYFMLILCVITVTSIVVSGLFIHKYVSVPMKILINAADEVGNGNLDTQVTVNSHDEVGLLSQAFNKMASDLKRVIASKDLLDQEISARKAMEKELWESQQRYKALMNNSLMAIAVIDKNHRLLEVNPIFAGLFNKSPGSFVGKQCFRESEKRDAICPHCPGVRAMISGKTEIVETQGVLDNGRLFDAKIRAVPFLGPDGQVEGFIEMVEDVTELKRAETQLRESEEKYRKQFEGALDGIILADCETGLMIDCNEAALKLVGRDKSELIGQHQRILHPPDTFDGQFTKSFKSHLEKEGELIETAIVTRNGDIRDVEIKGSIFDVGDRKVLQGIFRDVTKNKQKERELEQTQDELRQALNKAEQSERVKSEFLANMSHEIRTPMNAIIGFSEIMKEQSLSEDQMKMIKLIHDSGNSLLGLINDILDISKIESGRMDIECIEMSLEKLLDTVYAMLKLRADQKGLDFQVIRADGLPCKINADPTRLRQCLFNLVGNAFKFTQQGHVYLRVDLQRENDIAMMGFHVEDTGIGIPEDKQGHIFDAFTQADGSTTRQYGGTGLGLKITKQLAIMMGGRITVASTPNQGSTFSLVIPIGEVDALNNVPNGNSSFDDLEENVDAADVMLSGHILVAEDVVTNQILIETILTSLNLTVEIVGDGDAVIEKALDKPYDLILMDIQMPKKDGYEASRILREKGIETPIIALTAHSMSGDRLKCVEAGCNDYLSKPIDKKKMISKLRHYLSFIEASQACNSNDSGISKESPSIISDLIVDAPVSDNQEPTKICPIDYKDAEVRGLNADLVKALYPTFILNTSECIASLQQATETRDIQKIRTIAHTIKGTASNLAANNLSETALDLEKACDENRPDLLSKLIDQLLLQWHRLETYGFEQQWIEPLKHTDS